MKLICAFIFSVTAIISISGNPCFAQNYQTKKGVLSITSGSNENITTFHSNKLHVVLNLKTAEFEFILPIKSLHSGVDSINHKIFGMENSEMKVEGTMRMDGINTQPHSPIHFVFNAVLTSNDLTKELQGVGHLEHIPGNDQPACRLQLTFEVLDFELIDGYRDDFSFQIMQSILYQRNMN